MANPRRSSYSTTHQISIPSTTTPTPTNPFQIQTLLTLSTLKHFLKKPHAIPFLLSIFLLLTWVSLRLQHHHNISSSSSNGKQKLSGGGDDEDHNANLVRFGTNGYPSTIMKDKRGWMLDPIAIAQNAHISGGAVTCASIHVGEIRPGGMRGNHRHHTCNETILIWGAKTKYRFENNAMETGYAEVTVGADEVAVAASPSGTAHAILNMDRLQTTYFLGCQDSIINYNTSTSDFNVWKDL